jgi:hypothetical protein
MPHFSGVGARNSGSALIRCSAAQIFIKAAPASSGLAQFFIGLASDNCGLAEFFIDAAPIKCGPALIFSSADLLISGVDLF